jgi:hypothetical protein
MLNIAMTSERMPMTASGGLGFIDAIALTARAIQERSLSKR